MWCASNGFPGYQWSIHIKNDNILLCDKLHDIATWWQGTHSSLFLTSPTFPIIPSQCFSDCLACGWHSTPTPKAEHFCQHFQWKKKVNFYMNEYINACIPAKVSPGSEAGKSDQQLFVCWEQGLFLCFHHNCTYLDAIMAAKLCCSPWRYVSGIPAEV